MGSLDSHSNLQSKSHFESRPTSNSYIESKSKSKSYIESHSESRIESISTSKFPIASKSTSKSRIESLSTSTSLRKVRIEISHFDSEASNRFVSNRKQSFSGPGSTGNGASSPSKKDGNSLIMCEAQGITHLTFWRWLAFWRWLMGQNSHASGRQTSTRVAAQPVSLPSCVPWNIEYTAHVTAPTPIAHT